jgi:hypothetical protein
MEPSGNPVPGVLKMSAAISRTDDFYDRWDGREAAQRVGPAGEAVRK